MSFLDSFKTNIGGAPAAGPATGFQQPAQGGFGQLPGGNVAGFQQPQGLPPASFGQMMQEQPAFVPGSELDKLQRQISPIGNLASESHLAVGTIAYREMTVLSLILLESLTYNQMYTRPYVSNLQAQAIRNLENGVDQFQRDALDPMTLGHLTQGFITVSSTPEAPVQIANGWDTKRMSFELTVRARTQEGSNHLFKIQGYTDHFGVTDMTGKAHCDPKMVFIINDITKLSAVETMGGTNTRVYSSHNTLFDLGFERVGGFNEKRMMRPQDMNSVLASGIYSQSTNTSNIYNTSNVLMSAPSLSSRNNAMPGAYLSKLLDGYLQANDQVGDSFGNSEATIHGTALRYNRETLPTANPFLEKLNEYSTNGYATGKFMLRDLMRLDPEIDKKIRTVFNNPNENRTIQFADESGWNDRGIEMSYACTIVQALPSMMVRAKVGVFGVRVDNYGGGRTPTASPIAGMAYGTDVGPNVFRALSNNLISLVLAGLSANYEQPFTVIVQCNLYAETRVTVSVQGGPPRDYVFPTFTDSLTSPVITASNETVSNMAMAVGTVAETVANVLSQKGMPTFNDFTTSNSNFNL